MAFSFPRSEPLPILIVEHAKVYIEDDPKEPIQTTVYSVPPSKVPHAVNKASFMCDTFLRPIEQFAA